MGVGVWEMSLPSAREHIGKFIRIEYIENVLARITNLFRITDDCQKIELNWTRTSSIAKKSMKFHLHANLPVFLPILWLSF